MTKRKALVITDGLLDDTHAKTCHGLLRGSERFEVVGIIDHVHAGKDAAQVVPNVAPGVPVFATLESALEQGGISPECLIIGIATEGGVLPGHLRDVVLAAIQAGLNIVNGLHETLGDDPVIGQAAAQAGVEIHDIRKPKSFRDLHFWDGSILDVACPIIAVLGIDCAVGKRTTAKLLTQALAARGLTAEMIYTGQTGWMLGYEYGFIFDATPNDFVSGEMEHAIVSCWNERRPDIIFLEGQSALRNPSGPCGSEYLLSANARAVILQHPVGREYYIGCENLGCRLPTVAQEIELIGMYGAETLAISLNASQVSRSESEATAKQLQSQINLPVTDPFQDLEPLVEAVLNYTRTFTHNGVPQ
ncbi:MAG: hypothetical protein COA73_03930 [Candidatus Hydrogenedentota bacterium]|nr:MAG: hypothetical protein COA73_03930 [Candidatus Hydrogenedentota bacterium]